MAIGVPFAIHQTMLVVLCYPCGDYYYCYDEDCANRIGHIAIEPHDFAVVYAPYFFSVNDDQRYVNDWTYICLDSFNSTVDVVLQWDGSDPDENGFSGYPCSGISLHIGFIS